MNVDLTYGSSKEPDDSTDQGRAHVIAGYSALIADGTRGAERLLGVHVGIGEVDGTLLVQLRALLIERNIIAAEDALTIPYIGKHISMSRRRRTIAKLAVDATVGQPLLTKSGVNRRGIVACRSLIIGVYKVDDVNIAAK